MFMQLLTSCGRLGVTTASSSQRKCTGFLNENFLPCYDYFTRCSKCLTKSWCSRECQQKDREEKHKEFCIKGAEQRKVKGALRSGGKRR